jgi:hypothetical protein
MSEDTGKLATYCTANTVREIYFKVRNHELWQTYLKHHKVMNQKLQFLSKKYCSKGHGVGNGKEKNMKEKSRLPVTCVFTY